jgi:hypothetical protein
MFLCAWTPSSLQSFLYRLSHLAHKLARFKICQVGINKTVLNSLVSKYVLDVEGAFSLLVLVCGLPVSEGLECYST